MPPTRTVPQDDPAELEERTTLLVQWRETLLILAPIVLLAIAAMWFASRFVEPAPPRAIAISTGGPTGAYHAFGQRYAASLAKSGITLDVRSSAGSIENVKRITDADSGVQVALLQGGITDSKATPGLMSLGRLFLEPVWVFYRGGGEAIDRLAQLQGKRVGIGAEGSGTRALAEALFKPSGLLGGASVLSPLSGQAGVDAMAAGEIDAIVLVMAPEAPLVQSLLRDSRFNLMSLAQAEAYTRIFPYLQRIVLPRGVVDLVADLPKSDIAMLAASATLVARDDLHPALVGLLVDAVQDVHAGSGLFQRAGDFPRLIEFEFPVSEDAARVYKSGQSFLKRHLPFWLATFIERSIVMLVPIATILLPLFKIVPFLYQWRIKRRIFYWYRQLKLLDRRMAQGRGSAPGERFRAEIERIEDAVRVIPVPLAFSEQLFNLRSAVELVRQKAHAAA